MLHREHVHRLTPREIDVLRLYAKGYTEREVATELFIDPRTVARHSNMLKDKLEAKGNLRLAIYIGYQQGIIEPPTLLPQYEILLTRAKDIINELEQQVSNLKKG